MHDTATVMEEGKKCHGHMKSDTIMYNEREAKLAHWFTEPIIPGVMWRQGGVLAAG